jgi:hypothetical protein
MKPEETKLLYEAELNTLVHLPEGSQTMRSLIMKYGFKRLRLGRKVKGLVFDIKTEKRVPSYKTTAYRLVFANDLELNITSFLYRQLKKREKLPVETFNCYG